MTPASITVVGASPKKSRGTRVLENLLRAGYEGDLTVVHPTADEVLGVPAYPSISALPKAPDLAVLSIPAGPVLDVVAEAAKVGVGAVTVLAIGFGEGLGAGDDGGLRAAAGDDLLICGPNGFGVASIRTSAIGFNGRLPEQLIPGPVGFISQSGGLAASFPSYMMRRKGMGFSFIASPGNELDVGFEDYLEFMIDDPETTVIGAYLETVRRPWRIRELGVRASENGTTIIVMKAGRSPFAQEASMAHTSALATDDSLVDALLRQSGIVRVDSLNELSEAMSIAASPKFPRAGWRVGVLSGSGGECSHVSDALTAEGFEVPPLAESTHEQLRTILPEFSVARNPLDSGGSGIYENPTVFPRMFEMMLSDPGFETLALVLGLDTRDWLAEAIVDGAAKTDHFVLVYNSMITGIIEPDIIAKLASVGVPLVEGTEIAFSALAKLLRRRVPIRPTSRLGFERWIANDSPVRNLGFMGASAVLQEIGIETPPTKVVTSEAEALAAAAAIGYPVALKIDHPDVTHKTEVGGVRLGIASDDELTDAYGALQAVLDGVPGAGSVIVQSMASDGIHMILGLKVDPVIGPAVLVGLGGIFAEILHDVAVLVAPFDADDAIAALRSLKGYQLFEGARGAAPVSPDKLVQMMVALGDWALQQGDRISVLEVNPLIVFGDGSAQAVDVVIGTKTQGAQ
jgi:acyl-CoA synthetase (NDP forming)